MKITSPDMLAHSLKSARRQLQLTQQQAAKQVGIKQATISAFENRPENSRVRVTRQEERRTKVRAGIRSGSIV